jgi:hypothetical protein
MSESLETHINTLCGHDPVYILNQVIQLPFCFKWLKRKTYFFTRSQFRIEPEKIHATGSWGAGNSIVQARAMQGLKGFGKILKIAPEIFAEILKSISESRSHVKIVTCCRDRLDTPAILMHYLHIAMPEVQIMIYAT